MSKGITIKLSEHDAWRLLALLKNEERDNDEVWARYWGGLATSVSKQLEGTYLARNLRKRVRPSKSRPQEEAR